MCLHYIREKSEYSPANSGTGTTDRIMRHACSSLPLLTILSLATMLIASQVSMYANSACLMTTVGQLPQFKEWFRLNGNIQTLNTYYNSI